jgi:hypothetical protein
VCLISNDREAVLSGDTLDRALLAEAAADRSLNRAIDGLSTAIRPLREIISSLGTRESSVNNLLVHNLELALIRRERVTVNRNHIRTRRIFGRAKFVFVDARSGLLENIPS